MNPKPAQALKKGPSKKQQQEKAPHDELISNLKQIASGKQKLVRDYLAHLVDPAGTNPVRIPDVSVNMNPTGLVTSVMSIDVNANFDADARFCAIVSPTLGDASDPSYYKVALVDNGGPVFPTDLSIPGSFSKTSGTVSLTVDPNASMLLQPPASSYIGTSSVVTLTDDPLGITSGTFLVNNATTDSWNPNLGAPPIDSAIMSTTPTSVFLLSPGQYDVDVSVSFNGIEALFRTLVLFPIDANVETSSQFAVANDTNSSVSGVVSVYDKPGRFGVRFTVSPMSNSWLSEITIVSSWYRPDMLVTPATRGYPLDGGYVREYCPVAMSVLATSMVPELVAGGNIACAWLSPGTCDADVFVAHARNSVGNLSLVENLRRYPGAYDGKLSEGCYQVWKPSSFEDCNLYSPSIARDRAWPCLIVSGQANSANTIGTHFVIRLKITTTYQYYTDIIVFPLQIGDGGREIMEAAFRLLRTFPTSSANGPHWENIKEFFRRIGMGIGKAVNFYQSNAATINAVGSGLLTLAALI